MAAIIPGLCSVTFRHLDTDAVIAIAAEAGLEAIEWGADVHLPPGDPTLAARVRASCEAVGILCPSYGSYFAPSQSSDDQVDEMDAVVGTAASLGASTVRVWAPWGVRPGASVATTAAIARGLGVLCDRAAESQLTIALEFHPDTLTETAASARCLLHEVDRPNLRIYWQPAPGAPALDALAELRAVLADLAHLHVFAWERDSSRRPLEARADLWREALAIVGAQAGDTRVAYLEFVEDDDPDALRRDAATLRGWLEDLR